MINKKLVLVIIFIWFSIVFGWVIKSEYTLQGKEVLLKTIPVDPRDLLMGDYVILNYEIGHVDSSVAANYNMNSVIYSILKVNEKNVASIEKITNKKPESGLFLKGKIKKCNTNIPLLKMGKCIQYGIESYYVQEKTGIDIEKSLQNDALVKIAIDKNGNAKVKGFIQNKK